MWELLYRSPLAPYLIHRYDYQLSPSQLAYLVQCLDRTRDVPGDVAEIGCAYGHTTVFLKTHMDASGIDKHYYCLDTFAGFTADDIYYERANRDKASVYEGFADNSLRRFLRVLRSNRLEHVTPIQTDVNDFDFTGLPNLSFCLIDVDLYRPVKRSLEQIYCAMSPGGLIVVDDCRPNTDWDGALQAYGEFTAAQGVPQMIRDDGLGVIER